MDERAKMIRTAYARPDLRPFLLPQIKEAKARWGRGVQYIPDTAHSLGFAGPNAELDAQEIAEILEIIRGRTVQNARTAMRYLARKLQTMKSDIEPDLSRAAIALFYQDMFLNLADESRRTFKNLPSRR